MPTGNLLEPFDRNVTPAVAKLSDLCWHKIQVAIKLSLIMLLNCILHRVDMASYY